MDALEIISEIAGKVNVYQMRNAAIGISGRPKKLLLGKEEWAALERYADEVCSFKISAADGPGRPEYNGMKIYPVDDENYIGVNA